MNNRLTRSDERFLGGVCAGLAEYFNLDISLVRVAYILLSVFSAGFPGLLVYIILWIVIPPK
ncbi:MAG: PspC domain-containing protein [Cyclobacteriaceae bacterium]